VPSRLLLVVQIDDHSIFGISLASYKFGRKHIAKYEAKNGSYGSTSSPSFSLLLFFLVAKKPGWYPLFTDHPDRKRKNDQGFHQNGLE